jgi:hypothetical protein
MKKKFVPYHSINYTIIWSDGSTSKQKFFFLTKKKEHNLCSANDIISHAIWQFDKSRQSQENKAFINKFKKRFK